MIIKTRPLENTNCLLHLVIVLRLRIMRENFSKAIRCSVTYQ